jgi:hypothetical protein
MEGELPAEAWDGGVQYDTPLQPARLPGQPVFGQIDLWFFKSSICLAFCRCPLRPVDETVDEEKGYHFGSPKC